MQSNKRRIEKKITVAINYNVLILTISMLELILFLFRICILKQNPRYSSCYNLKLWSCIARFIFPKHCQRLLVTQNSVLLPGLYHIYKSRTTIQFLILKRHKKKQSKVNTLKNELKVFHMKPSMRRKTAPG